jgi:PQQ-dependent dehydrogenase (methanol/ethanol family)
MRSPLASSRQPTAGPASLAALAGVLLALLLAACGGGGGGSGSTATPTTGATPAPTASTPASTTPATAAGGADERFSPDDWPVFGRDRDNTRYAPQTQIDRRTVSRLGEAWHSDLGGNQFLQESFPIEVDGVLYVTTSTDEVYAFDAATGKVKWKYTPKVDFSLSTGVGGYGISVNRGVAVSDGMVYLLTFDCQLKAISAATGEEVFSSQVDDPKSGAYETMSPTVYDGQVFVGNSGSDEGVRGFVAAYDAKTGKQNWRFWTIPPVGTGWRAKGTGGGTVYMAPTIDTKTGNVLFGTANPSPAIVGTKRPGQNLYTSSVVALKADTGKLVWFNQEVPHDLWDYDAASPVLLLDTVIDGRKRRIAAQAGKSGYLFMLDAETGKDVFPRLAFVTQNHRPPTTSGTLECPGPLGGSQYAPLAYSPQVNAVYVSGIEFCFILTVTDENLQGESNFGGTRSIPSDSDPSGTFDAVDMSTGRFLWRRKIDSPMAAGAAATAGGLVFTVDQKGVMYAFDAKTGVTRWKADLGLAGAAAPVVYSVAGKQYVAVAIGGAGMTASNKLGPIGSRVVVLTLDGRKIVPAKPSRPAGG